VIPIYSINTHPVISRQPQCRVFQSQTNLEIGKVQLNFYIRSTGEYLCDFSLKVVGNEQTANGLGGGEFTVSSLQINDFSLTYYSSPVTFSRSEENDSSVYKFNLNQSIPVGMQTTLKGGFSGTVWENVSGIYTYHLGIEWGTMVGLQNTKIWLDGQKFTIVSIDPIVQLTSREGSMIVLAWNDVLPQGFNCILKIEPQEPPPTDLIVDLTAWNATIGQTLEVLISNIGFYEIQGWILPSTSWITVNVSKFILAPSQEISVLFSISDTISPGVNGSIEIISIKWIDKILPFYFDLDTIFIPIYVLDVDTPPRNQDPFDFLLPLGLIFIVIISSYTVFHQREGIKQIIQKKIPSSNDFPLSTSPNFSLDNSQSVRADINDKAAEIPYTTWKSVHSKWNSILPEREMQLLEILISQGSMNQQALADELGVSKGTISRIISRLERKKLIIRERFGVSKLIKINRDRLL
jgi:uncharacterized membrane protein